MAPNHPSEQHLSGCYQCGSPEGTSFSLCAACSERNNVRRDRLKEKLRIDGEIDSDPLFTRLGNSFIGWWVAIAAVFMFIAGLGFLLAARVHLPWGAVLFVAAVCTLWFISIVTSLMLWIGLLVSEPMWGALSVLFPVLVYRYVYMHWERARYIFLVHAVCSIVAVIGTLLLLWNAAGILSRDFLDRYPSLRMLDAPAEQQDLRLEDWNTP